MIEGPRIAIRRVESCRKPPKSSVIARSASRSPTYTAGSKTTGVPSARRPALPPERSPPCSSDFCGRVMAEESLAVGGEMLAAGDQRSRGIAVLRGHAQLRVQALGAPEREPVAAPAVGLRAGTDEVVRRPAEFRARDAMLACERFRPDAGRSPHRAAAARADSSSIHAFSPSRPAASSAGTRMAPAFAQRREPIGSGRRTSGVFRLPAPCENLPLGAAHAPCIRARPDSRSAMRSSGSSSPICNRTSEARPAQ